MALLCCECCFSCVIYFQLILLVEVVTAIVVKVVAVVLDLLLYDFLCTQLLRNKPKNSSSAGRAETRPSLKFLVGV